MFNWFKKPQPPTTCAANPGRGISAKIGFANGQRTWQEEVEVVSSLSGVLKSGGHAHAREKSWIELDGGFVLQPQFVYLKPLEKGGVQTTTTIEVSHPTGIPAGVFEFQHSTGNTTSESIAKGFDDWMQQDLPVFLDTIRAKPKFCTCLKFELPETGSSPARTRRVLLGPVSHLVVRPAEGPPEEHPFCPCCLFTRSLEVMKPRVSDEKFYGIRLFAMRDPNGSDAADCRINGEEWEPGKSALVKYVDSWPDRGVEFRKQYVIVQNHPAAT